MLLNVEKNEFKKVGHVHVALVFLTARFFPGLQAGHGCSVNDSMGTMT
jgi:hypothetical protein